MPGRRGTALPPAAEASLALAGGALFSLPFVQTAYWPLQIVLIALLAWRCGDVSPARAALIGSAFATAWLAVGTWWIYISLHRYGELPAPLAVAAVFGLSFSLSWLLGLALAAFARWRRGRVFADAALFAACWLLAELARGVLFTGFPWLASGYGLIDSPLAVLAPWLGVYGIGAIAALLAALLVARSARVRYREPAAYPYLPPASVFVILALLWFAGPPQFSRPSGTLSLSLLQTNVAQDEKFAAERMPETLAWLSEQLLAAKGDLVIAPETAIPLLPGQLAPSYWEPIKQRFQQAGARPEQAALIGLPLGDYEQGYTNSVAGLSRASAAAADGYYRYDKHHLVPFGEFIPYGFHWFTALMNIPLGDFNRGPLVAPSFVVRGERVAPNICYEDLFGEELAARFADAATAPTIFANLSNIGWFGDTIAVAQHLQISRMRTLEFQRPMVRATNTGATVVIDHHGRVTQSLAPFTLGVLQGSVEGRDGLTPYARWAAAAGLWPLFLAAAAVLLLGVYLPRRL